MRRTPYLAILFAIALGFQYVDELRRIEACSAHPKSLLFLLLLSYSFLKSFRLH